MLAREWRAQRRQALAGTPVPNFGLGTAVSGLDASLWLAAYEHHKLRVLTGLRAQRLVGDDQGRSWRRYFGDTIQYVLWDGDPVERRFPVAWVGYHRFDALTAVCMRRAVPLVRASICMSAIQRDHAPSRVDVIAGAVDGGENLRADRTIGILDRDRALQDGLEALPDIKTLGLAANEDRYRLEVQRRLARRLGRHDARVLSRDGGFARRRRGIELRLQFGFGGCPLRIELSGARRGIGFRILSVLLCLGRPRGGNRAIGGQ